MAQKINAMFTQCPECQTTQSLTLEQLRGTRGMIQCRHCSVLFDALALISETEAIASEKNLSDSTLPWDHEKRSKSIYWSIGVCFCLLLLVAQMVYFEGYNFTQSSKIRPFLTAVCQRIACRLPDYKNPDQFNIVGSFKQMPDQNYEFHAAISNEADFPQVYPNVRLTLLNFNSKPFAARVFQPHDYLPEAKRASTMNPDTSTEISLKIAAPKSAVGGSSFELVD